jgi:hypothetical protein
MKYDFKVNCHPSIVANGFVQTTVAGFSNHDVSADLHKVSKKE